MPAAIPDRFSLEIRLGRDGDLEEWLATDTSLDRPVLVRSLGPESTPERRNQFVESVSAAAKVSHPHLTRVFAVGLVEGGAYSVSEWTTGSSAADHIQAAHPFDLPDFLPNATGLAGALAALHGAGAAHGAVDLSAISYSVAHAAKLGAFGRVPRTDTNGDVRALAGALETALTGEAPGGPPPSERIDGIPRIIDQILRSAQSGDLSALELEKALSAAPTPRQPAPQPRAASRRLILGALALVLFAVGLVALGRVFTGGGEPIIPAPDVSTSATQDTAPATSTTTVSVELSVENAASYDPFGGGGENDATITNLIDGDTATSWRTERYDSPLPDLKPGVGVTFSVSGTPSRLQLVRLSTGTRFELYWSDAYFPQPAQWERVARAQAPPGAGLIDLPPRNGGFWLIWLIDLPLQVDGSRYASMSEVRFLP